MRCVIHAVFLRLLMLLFLLPHCGLWGCKNRPLHFLARCPKRRLNQAPSVLTLKTGFLSALFIRSTCCVNISLERLLWQSLYLVRRLSPQCPGRRVLTTFSMFVYRFIVLLCVCLVPRPYTTYFILLWHDIACLC